MSSDDIESIAIQTIKSYFKYSEVVSPKLTEEDKGIAWDGFLNLYSNSSKKKECYIGRVTVQSKGKVVKKQFKEKNFSYKIEATDLKLYQKEGTVFFVTQILEEKQKERLFYRKLTPLLIANILRAHKGVAEPSVRMYPVPDDIKTMEAELGVFMEDCHKQAIAVGKPVMSFEEAKKKGIKTFSFVTSNRDRNGRSLIDYMTEKELYMYAVVDEEHHIEWPIGDGPVHISARQVVKKTVSVGGKIYYASYVNEIREREVVITVGNCITMIFPKDGSNATISYKKSTTLLNGSIHEAEFVLALAKEKGFKIGDMFLSLNVTGTLIDEYKEAVVAWRDWRNVLEAIGCHSEFDLARVSKKDEEAIACLIQIIKHKEPIKLKDIDTGLILLDIANVCLLLWCFKDEEGKCMMGSIFDHSVEMHCKIGETDRVPASPFSYLQKENWMTTDNLPLDLQIPYYEEMMPKNPYLFDMVCVDVFSMMGAYDSLPEDHWKRNWLLNGVENVVGWAMEHELEEKVRKQMEEFKEQVGLRWATARSQGSEECEKQ